MTNHVYEGLGYTLRNYDPCFNYNQDRFCCSKRGDNFRQNILLSEAPLAQNYTQPSYYTPSNIPLWLAKTGIVNPKSYELTPQDRWYVWCNRMPCSLDQHGVPCQKGQPYCNNPGSCAKRQ